MFKIAVLISGSGSNLQSIIDSVESGFLNCSIEAVVSDNRDAKGVERANSHRIKTFVFDKREFRDNLSDKILEAIGEVDLIVLAGFLSILKGEIIKKFRNRIINIHPSLIPAFCGNGMYGIRVHEKAIEHGVKFSGCTVHFVDDGTDTGPIILQRVVPIFSYDTPKSLQERVLEEEHKILPLSIKYLINDQIEIKGRRVIIHD